MSGPVGRGQWWLRLERPFAGAVVAEGDIGIRGEGRHQVARPLQLPSQRGEFPMDPDLTGAPAVGAVRLWRWSW
ncbi:hypothetical protein AB5J49_43635 [Streptomyces sp. R28]|uniref:Uncharacterized protein n=1 Tax=Streptomyces sp. R28 TaxID=3238628 RepID=A0AB39QEC5_9ACTN